MFVFAEKEEGESGKTQAEIANAYRSYAKIKRNNQKMDEKEPGYQTHADPEREQTARDDLKEAVQIYYRHRA